MSAPFILCLVAVASAVLGLGSTAFSLVTEMNELLLLAPAFGLVSAICGIIAAGLIMTRGGNQLAF